ncbi:MAG: mannan-binding lectin [Pseudomonas sp.]|uniref:mannan-binding lectin n=1 Tax=Pseudomonas sp. TaxID=306 RepID=UPI00299D5291|nr:mannan-binding lectin [Pseudomonas sp.]MDX1721571.1 mannan-binding lectin [Pseudomonas sp.]
MPSRAWPILLSLLLAVPLLVTQPAHADASACNASASWISNPSPPGEVPEGASADFCDFYQFSWQWFLDLVSPAAADPSQRNFQVAANYPLLQADGVDSCAANAPLQAVFVRVEKAKGANGPFVVPERTGQAGGGDTIYDQNGSVVFYDIRFSRNLCNVGQIQAAPNFPAGTTELKSAWRIIGEAEKPDYFWMEADIDGVPGNELLGMIGFHMVIATALHPEFIWATFEHRSNVPECSEPVPAPATGWSFTSATCAAQLPDVNGTCSFNSAQPSSSLTGTPTEICRVNHDGSNPADHEGASNIAIIDGLNTQIQGFLAALPSDNPMAVWQNYMNVGALWENDISQPSSTIANQRGSMRLANAVMETTFQNVDLNSSFVSNCFGCHNYEVAESNTLPAAGLSHIFDDIMQGQCKATDVQAGPIWSNNEAQEKCAQTCKDKGGWNGNWTTTVPGEMSVCGCCSG